MSRWWRGVGKLLAVTVSVAFVLLLLTLAAYDRGLDPSRPAMALGNVAELTAPWAVPLQLLRCGLWGLVWWKWEWVGNRWFRAGESSEAMEAWSNSRPAVIATLALVEGMIVLRQVG